MKRPHLTARLSEGSEESANAGAVAKGNPGACAEKSDPPVLPVHGSEDPVVPIDQSEGLHEVPMQAGVDATLVHMEGVGHFSGRMRRGPEVMDRVKAFFDRTLKSEQRSQLS